MGKKLDIHYCIELGISKNLECLDTSYINSKTLMKWKCLTCNGVFHRHISNLTNNENTCPHCCVKNTIKTQKCEICSKDFTSKKHVTSAKFCSSECRKTHSLLKEKASRIHCICPLCKRDKGFLLPYRIKGQLPQDRPCKVCRAKAVSEKTKGRIPWNKGIPLKESTKQKLREHNLGKASSQKGTTLSYETRKKISCSVKGIAVEDFTDFSEKEQRALYKNLDLSKQCFKRDSFTCQKCSAKGVHFHAHHMNSWKHFVEQRYKIDNLITLCESCHKAFHKTYGNGVKEPNTEEQIIDFLKKENNNG